MSVEQRFAWMEQMLDTTISCYEAHREALEKVYADLYRLHSADGCIHLAPAEADKMLRNIADVLEKNALKLPAFDGSEEREEPSSAAAAAAAAATAEVIPPSTRDSSLPQETAPSAKRSQPSSKAPSNHPRASPGESSTAFRSPDEGPIASDVGHDVNASAKPASPEREPSRASSSQNPSKRNTPPPPANLPTAQHRTPSVASSNPPSHVNPQEQSRRSASPAASTTSSTRRLRSGAPGAPLTGWPAKEDQPSRATSTASSVAPRSASQRSTGTVKSNATSTNKSNREANPNPTLAEQFQNYRIPSQQQQQQQRTPTTEDPLYNPYTRHGYTNRSAGQPTAPDVAASDSLPLHRDSLSMNSSQLGGSQAPGESRNTINPPVAKPASRPRSQAASTAPSHPKSNNPTPQSSVRAAAPLQDGDGGSTYGHPDGMVDSVAPRRQQQRTAGTQNGSEPPVSATPSVTSLLNGDNAPREEPEPHGEDVEGDCFDAPPPKSLGKERPLRTAVPRRTAASKGNDSRQFQELVYKRHIDTKPKNNAVLEDDPAVEAYLSREDERLAARRSRELQEIKSAPGCKTEAEKKRERNAKLNGTSPSSRPNPADGALVVAGSNGTVAVAAGGAANGKPLMTAAEAQLRKELQVLQNQLEKMEHEWEITTMKNKESGQEPRYRQLQSRMQRVRADMDRVERELVTVQDIEYRRARGASVSRGTSARPSA